MSGLKNLIRAARDKCDQIALAMNSMHIGHEYFSVLLAAGSSTLADLKAEHPGWYGMNLLAYVREAEEQQVIKKLREAVAKGHVNTVEHHWAALHFMVHDQQDKAIIMETYPQLVEEVVNAKDVLDIVIERLGWNSL